MKIHALIAAVALAFGTSAFAQAPAAPAEKDTQAATAPAKAKAKAKVHKKKMKKTMKHASAHHAGTHAMGAGPSSPSTDVNSSSRQARMDAAYQDWLKARK